MNHTKNNQSACKIGGVSFFNARPILFGLEDDSQIDLYEAPPAQLAVGIDDGSFLAGLVPSIDYQKTDEDWIILPFAAIGSDGPVLTVQVFSKCPPEEVESVACDLDSHTSIVLSQIIFKHCFGQKLKMEPLHDSPSSKQAVLLIGDKVLKHLNQWPYSVDLGEYWQKLTGLPFVYAFWAAKARQNLDWLASKLLKTCDEGLKNIDKIIVENAHNHGFEPDIARQYLTENLTFEFTQDHQKGLAKFYELAYECGLVKKHKPLSFYQKTVTKPSKRPIAEKM